MTAAPPCRVLIVDDSAVVRQMLTEILGNDPDIEVVGTAADPLLAREKIKRLRPDVITLDVEMPRMDGLAFLENLMRLHPIPVVMVSSLTERGADITLQALALGAVDFVSKPKLDVARGLQGYADEITAKVRMAARSRVRALVRPAAPRITLDAAAPPAAPALRFRTTDRLIAIGASAGGTEALRVVLEAMPPDAPAIVITQHLPAAFSTPFAERLDRHSAMSVREAHDGEAVVPGHVYLPPGGRHLRIIRTVPAGDAASTTVRRSTGTSRRSTCCSVRWRAAQAPMPSASSSPAWATTARAACSNCATPVRRRWCRTKPPASSGACPAARCAWARRKNRCRWTRSRRA